MKKIGFAGSFDPITNGHMHVINEALNIADEVHVVVSINPSKKYMFSGKDRKDMIEVATGNNPNVKVHLVENNYVAAWLADNGINYLIRGIRNANDFEHEKLIQRANMDVFGRVNTLFIMPPSDLESVSSSFVKGLIGPENWPYYIKKFIPENVFKKILKNYIFEKSRTFLRDSRDGYEKLLQSVINSYDDKDRHYHNIEHIVSMLTDYTNAGFNDQTYIDAIIFHDVVYQNKCDINLKTFLSDVDDNATDEEKSAIIAERVTHDEYVAELIMGTSYSYFKQPTMISDFDMLILGKPKYIYEEYSKNIRKEYSQYSDEDFAKGRIQVLIAIKNWINDNKIYVYNWSRKYKDRALENINEEINKLLKK